MRAARLWEVFRISESGSKVVVVHLQLSAFFVLFTVSDCFCEHFCFVAQLEARVQLRVKLVTIF